jgi:hypothetical protein
VSFSGPTKVQFRGDDCGIVFFGEAFTRFFFGKFQNMVAGTLSSLGNIENEALP